MIPESFYTISVVIGMVVLTVLTAGLVTSYQRSQQERRQRIRRLVQGAQRNGELLENLGAISLPREVRLLLRNDIVARYRAIRRVHRQYPGIDQLLAQAEQAVAAEGPEVGAVLPVPPTQQVFEDWVTGLLEVVDLVRHGRFIEPVPLATRNVLLAELLDREAECLFGFHMNEVDKLKQAGRDINARSRIQHLQELLRGVGSRSERLRELFGETEQAYQFLLNGPPGAGEPAPQAQAGNG